MTSEIPPDMFATASGLVSAIPGLAARAGRDRGSVTLRRAMPRAVQSHCHIPRQGFKVTNGREYDTSLRGRGSLTVWFTEEAIASWKAEPRTTRVGQTIYSGPEILTALTLRAVCRLALRQTEGLIGSIIRLLGLDLAVPDHSTLNHRAATLDVPQPRACSGAGPLHLLEDSTRLKLCGAGEWLREKHGTRVRRSWRKLHLGVDADTGGSPPRF